MSREPQSTLRLARSELLRLGISHRLYDPLDAAGLAFFCNAESGR